MKRLVLCLGLLWAWPSGAQVLPALYDVTGVAGDDVLNIRAAADAGSPVRGGLSADATAVEVVALSPNGKWALINTGEGAGWVAFRFLHRQDRPDWYAVADHLQCSGTEPFWTLFLDPTAKSAHINTPDEEGPELDLTATWPGSAQQPIAAVQYSGDDASGVVVLRGQSCSDGMSDQSFGIVADLFQAAGANQPAQTLHGCCRLAP